MILSCDPKVLNPDNNYFAKNLRRSEINELIFHAVNDSLLAGADLEGCSSTPLSW